jgi:DNA-binding SARP family transcriptional activator
MEGDMRFEILGPMRVRARGREITITAGRDRAVLATLILHANRIVPVSDLVDLVWADGASRDGRGQLHGCVSRLRKRLESLGVAAEIIVTVPEGYLLRADSASVDLLEFRSLVADARAAAADGQRDNARDRYRTALKLWRGAALADVDRGTVRQVAAGLDEERTRALEERIDLELALGGAGELVGELTELAHQYPYRERLHATLMLALYRADRQADALAAYHQIRRTLVAELGQEPGAALRELHQRILTGDEALRPPGTGDGTRSVSNHHLPRAVADFTGRDADLAWLSEVASEADPYAPTVIAIDGMPGVGKTSLAVRAAHAQRSRYPDGQLFVDLHGQSEHQPLDVAAALNTLLRQLGIPPARIADELDGRISQWRAELAKLRVLVVLDNAANSAQVSQLLPVASGCLTLVTSRRRLVELDGARPRSVGTLAPRDAVALLERVAGPRVRDEPHAAAEVAKRCGYLPLALRLAAARLAHRPAWRVRDLADRLSAAHTPLAELSIGDRTVASAFALSYAHLTPDCQRLFRLLGLHPGEDLDARVVAALADTGLAGAQHMLDELVDGNVVEEPRRGRYRLHDLVKAFARELALTTDKEAARRTAVERILDYYLHTAAAASSAIDPARRLSLKLDETGRPDLIEKHPEPATDWFESERTNLTAAVHQASIEGHHRYAWQLAGAIWRFLYRRSYLDDLVSTHRRGLASAECLEDSEATAVMHNYLASGYYQKGRCYEAIEHLQHALEQREHMDDRRGTTTTRRNLAIVYAVVGLHREAADECQRALAAARKSGDPATLAITFVNTGDVYLSLGRYAAALAYSRRGLLLTHEVGDEFGVAIALGNIGMSRARLGDLQPALRLLEAALRARRRVADRWNEAEALNELGVVHRMLGDLEKAAAYHREALLVVRETGLRRVEYAVCNDLGRTLLELGETSAALEMHRHSLAGTTKVQHKYEQARALDGIAGCLRATDPGSARANWLRALKLYQELEVPERLEVERQLATLAS